MTTRAHWILAWLGGVPIGVGNGVLREATYARRVPELAAHQISTFTALAAFTGYFAVLQRRWPLVRRRDALAVGAVWAGMTVLFEFGFGRAVADKPWSELVADYDIRHGRLWALVPLWMAVGPECVARYRA